MLPDYPEVKARVADALNEYFRRAVKARLSVFAAVPVSRLHEGTGLLLARESGSTETLEMNHVEALAELPVDLRAVEKLEVASVLRMLDTLADGLARQKFKIFLESISEAAVSVGNVTPPGLSPVEAFFAAVEKRQLDFTADGTPVTTHLLVGSEAAAERLKQTLAEIAATPELESRYRTIINRKREEWRDREAARNLAE